MSFISNHILIKINWINENSFPYAIKMNSDSHNEEFNKKIIKDAVNIANEIDNLIYLIGSDVEQFDEYWKNIINEDNTTTRVLNDDIAFNLNSFWNLISQDAKDIYMINYLSLTHNLFFHDGSLIEDYKNISYIANKYQYYNNESPLPVLPPELKEKLITQKFFYLSQAICNKNEITPLLLFNITYKILNNLLIYDNRQWTIPRIFKHNNENKYLPNGIKEVNDTSILGENIDTLEQFIFIYYVFKQYGYGYYKDNIINPSNDFDQHPKIYYRTENSEEYLNGRRGIINRIDDLHIQYNSK
jgi:hypothetical protein